MNWKLKSESDTDRVWAEVDGDGAETGHYRYELGLSLEDRVVDLSVPKPPRRWPWILAGSAVAAVAAADLISRLVA